MNIENNNRERIRGKRKGTSAGGDINIGTDGSYTSRFSKYIAELMILLTNSNFFSLLISFLTLPRDAA